MSQPEVVDRLIATYRNLNLMIRPLAISAAPSSKDGSPLLAALTELRQKEVAASQALKLMTLGEIAVGSGNVESAVTSQESANPGSMHVLLSEFGTARESILATIRELPAEEWTRPRAKYHGASNVRELIDMIVKRDDDLVQKIQALVPAR